MPDSLANQKDEKYVKSENEDFPKPSQRSE